MLEAFEYIFIIFLIVLKYQIYTYYAEYFAQLTVSLILSKFTMQHVSICVLTCTIIEFTSVTNRPVSLLVSSCGDSILRSHINIKPSHHRMTPDLSIPTLSVKRGPSIAMTMGWRSQQKAEIKRCTCASPISWLWHGPSHGILSLCRSIHVAKLSGNYR